MRIRLCTLAVGLVLLGTAGCSTKPTPSAATPSTTTPVAGFADEPVRFWAADSLGAVCFNRERTTHALVARARARNADRDAIANVPTVTR